MLSLRAQVVLQILAALGLFLAGCHGTLLLSVDSIVSLGDDDDSASTSDDDDDDTFSGEPTGVFHLAATIQHPQGRALGALGWFAVEDDVRGVEFGCERSLPEDEERGSEAIYLDAGPWAQFSTDLPEGEVWAFDLDREALDDRLYYESASDNNPNRVEAGALLDFQVPGGVDIPEFHLEDALLTHETFAVLAPSLAPLQDSLSVPLSEGVQFEWDPASEDGVEIVVVFFGDNGERWLTHCWVEDNGSFHLEEEWLEGFPLGTSGLLWFRRYTTAWHPAAGERPPLLMRGSLQHRWFVQLVDDGA